MWPVMVLFIERHLLSGSFIELESTAKLAHRVAQARADRFHSGADGFGYRAGLIAVSRLLLNGHVDPLLLLGIHTQRA
jgi:hypothetical protein